MLLMVRRRASAVSNHRALDMIAAAASATPRPSCCCNTRHRIFFA